MWFSFFLLQGTHRMAAVPAGNRNRRRSEDFRKGRYAFIRISAIVDTLLLLLSHPSSVDQMLTETEDMGETGFL
jgi:hypothetical protein